MSISTKQFLEELMECISEEITCYYEEAPPGASFPYAVVSGMYISDLEYGDSANFYLEVYADEKKRGATVELETLCDSLRNHLSDETLGRSGAFRAHVCFDSQTIEKESEFDLCHRRLTMTARIFYI